jgi:hypothetical protein
MSVAANYVREDEKALIEARELATMYPQKIPLARGREGLNAIQGEREEYWRILCEQAVHEQDPQRLLQLVAEINRLLLEKEERLVKLRRASQ